MVAWSRCHKTIQMCPFLDTSGRGRLVDLKQNDSLAAKKGGYTYVGLNVSLQPRPAPSSPSAGRPNEASRISPRLAFLCATSLGEAMSHIGAVPPGEVALLESSCPTGQQPLLALSGSQGASSKRLRCGGSIKRGLTRHRKRAGKGGNTRKASLGIFRQRHQHDLLNGLADSWDALT